MAELALESTACLACGATGGSVVYEATDHLYGVDARAYRLLRCGGCGLVYLPERPDRAAIASAYPDAYMWRQARTRPAADGLDEQLIAAYFRQLYARRAGTALARLPATPRVVDLGCGAGHFLAALAARRPGTYLGLDFAVGEAPPGVALAQADLNGGDLPNAEPGTRDAELPKPWDMVTMWHVLEHLHDPRAALARAYDALAPGGWLVLATQNFDALSRHLMGPRWPLNDVPRHLAHFTPATLTALVEAAGFTSVRVHHLTEHVPALGGHLFPHLVARPDGTLHGAPGLLLSALFLPVELAAVAAGRGCTFNLIARR